MIIFGKKLKELREGEGLTRLQLSKLLYVHSNTIRTWETGEHEPDIKTLIKLAKMFDVRVSYLLGQED